MSAEYLFMTDKQYDISYDTGDKVIQCGRHNDIFKLWLQWRSKGTEGFERQQDRLMDLAQYQVRRIKEQSDRFHLIMEPECVNVSFWYIPKRLRGVPHDANKEKELGKVREKFVLFFLLYIFLWFSDLPHYQGPHDAKGQPYGWLSTRRSTTQFLPFDYFIGSRHRGRC